MSTKEQRILTPEGGRYPFKVSDEYFDNLTARIMEQIPEEDEATVASDHSEQVERKAKVISIRQQRRRNLWIRNLSIAASFLLIATVALKFISIPSSTPVEQQKAESHYTQDNFNEDLMTYTMVDNVDVYYYLASEDFDE